MFSVELKHDSQEKLAALLSRPYLRAGVKEIEVREAYQDKIRTLPDSEFIASFAQFPSLHSITVLGIKNLERRIPGENIIPLLESLPLTLRTLYLPNMHWANTESNIEKRENFFRLLTRFKALNKLALFLEDSLPKESIKGLVQALVQLPDLSDLNLWLGDNDIGNQEAMHIAQVFEKLSHLSYLFLDLRETKLNEEAIRILTSLLAKSSQLSTLEINFTWNINLKDQAAIALAEALASIPALTYLSLNFWGAL